MRIQPVLHLSSSAFPLFYKVLRENFLVSSFSSHPWPITVDPQSALELDSAESNCLVAVDSLSKMSFAEGLSQ